MPFYKKYKALQIIIEQYGSVAVAFSGGVDSTFLLNTAHEVLGEKVIAVTAVSPLFPVREHDEAKSFCQKKGIRHLMIESNELKIDEFRNNPPNRCYICKKELFRNILRTAAENGINHVAEGSNMDDLEDYRPGLKAIEEMNIRSPLREAGLYKEEIRALSRELGLPTWNKPSFACLASRFVYGEPITEKKLCMIDQAEQFIRKLGFTPIRVRLHGDIARIEMLPGEFDRLLLPETREHITNELRKIGFSYITLDLAGYRTGSMNETLNESLL